LCVTKFVLPRLFPSPDKKVRLEISQLKKSANIYKLSVRSAQTLSESWAVIYSTRSMVEKFSSKKKLEIPECIIFKTVKIVFILLYRISQYDFNKIQQMVSYIWGTCDYCQDANVTFIPELRNDANHMHKITRAVINSSE
jgi:hypothetical protein